MTPYEYALLGVTAVIVVLLFVAIFGLLRLRSRSLDARRSRDHRSEAAILSSALQEAVSKLKAQEQAMSVRAAASEHLSGRIVDSLNAGLLVVNRTGLIEILNPAGRRLLRVDGDPVGGDYHDVMASAPPLVEMIQECLATAQPVSRRTVRMPGASPVTHFGVTVSPLGGPEDSRGLICLFADLTHVFELEEQLRLKEALARLGELTAGIAHEFRNGLATIHGYSRLIQPHALPEAYRPYLEGIRQEAEALGHVVTKFLDFARPEQMTFMRVDLQTVARRAADDLRVELPEDTSVEFEGEFGIVEGDEVLLRQVFGNLVRNAAEACEAGSAAPRIRITGHSDGGQCRVTVDDNGPGIPEASRERVFQPFFTSRSRGTGLGLAIVQKIVVIHNGRVSVGTSPLGGASIQTVWPLAAAAEAAPVPVPRAG
jgi:signal transduction histidine kinase